MHIKRLSITSTRRVFISLTVVFGLLVLFSDDLVEDVVVKKSFNPPLSGQSFTQFLVESEVVVL